MKIILSGITTTVEQGTQGALDRAKERLGLPPDCIRSVTLAKSSVDARRGPVRFVSAVAVELNEDGARRIAARTDLPYTEETDPLPIALTFGDTPLEGRPTVIGFGPGGMFAALLLARNGYRPIVLERGPALDARCAAVQRFWSGGALDSDANVQFGEGGAGAFSDGKLTTRIHDPYCRWVLRELVGFGAPEEILVQAKPHIGTDLLRGVVRALREEVVRLGGEMRFCETVTEFEVKSGTLRALQTTRERISTRAAILAVGHSARDTFLALERCGAPLAPKAFSVGVRIEHLQSEIDRALYGRWAGHPNLPHGEYQLSYREEGRAAYTFCMCPGGTVVAAASAQGQVVTNGMSRHDRALPNANSALAVSVGTEDFGTNWQDGVRFQQRLEAAAFELGGRTFAAPAMTVGELLKGPSVGKIEPSYPLGVRHTDVTTLFPPQVSDLLRRSLPILGRRLRGFDAPEALLTGVETRTSSPVRITRGEQGCAEGIEGLYPCGEGAGYAGGIVSAAVDGLRCAASLMARYAQPKEAR